MPLQRGRRRGETVPLSAFALPSAPHSGEVMGAAMRGFGRGLETLRGLKSVDEGLGHPFEKRLLIQGRISSCLEQDCRQR